MPIQTTYGINHAALYAGMINSVNPWNSVSKLNDTDAVIPFGKGVISSGENAMTLPVAGITSLQFIGVVKRELNRAYTEAQIADGARIGAVPGYDASVVTSGRIAVVATVNVTRDDPVALVLTGDNTGDFSNIAENNLVITNAKWLTTTTAGQVGEISLVLGG